MLSRARSVVLLVLAIVLVLMSAGCDEDSSSGKKEPTPTAIPAPEVPEKPTYTVQRGLVVDELSFTGRISPVLEEELFFKEGGRADRVYVERGDVVEAGTLLAELENDDLVRQLQQAQIELETTELNLQQAQDSLQYSIDRAQIDLEKKKLEMEKMREDLAAAQLDVDMAKAELDTAQSGPDPIDLEIAQRNLEKAKNSLWSAQADRDLADYRHGEDSADYDKAEAGILNAEANVRIAELNLQKLQKGPTEEELQQMQNDYQKALQRQRQTEIDLAIKEQDLLLSQMEVDNLEGDIDPQLTKAVERNRLALERLEAQLANTRIESPIDGEVTSVSAYEGRTVDAYKEVFVVSNAAELEVTADPMNSQLQRLAEGMGVTLALSSYPGQQLVGEIIQLPYPYGGGGGKALEEADDLTHISFDPQDLDLEAGDLVKVNVEIERKDDVLWLPPTAIRTFAGRDFVVVEEDGRQRRVDVSVGVEGDERVEIEEGLEEGQIVVGQ